ncbi:hypothetical protein KR009_006985 [Drosophila setifemur]|nr:hypothetical protein KR009_006985 [Drosophila setifemur]
MSDNEFERFEIRDKDLDNEFNINRPRGRRNKHQQIYGIWADDSEEESGGEAGHRRGRSARQPKDFTLPVNFVAGGIHQAGKKKTKQLKSVYREDLEQGEQSEDSTASARPAFGHSEPDISDSSEGERPLMSSKQKANYEHRSHLGDNQLGSNRSVGAWEQHTRGIGAKLLLQMGYEPGKGLGKDLQGISQPVQAHVRKGRGAIGAYGPETAASVGMASKLNKGDEDVREAKEFKEQLNKWRKGGSISEPQERQGKRYFYKSVEDVIAKSHKSSHMLSEKMSWNLVNVPVIDMTGPEKRVLSGYYALGQSKITPEEALYDIKEIEKGVGLPSGSVFSMPELTHNLQLLVSQCEQQIIAIDKQERECSNQQAVLENKQRMLEEIVELEKNHIRTLESVLARIERLSESPEIGLHQAEQIFRELLEDYAAEFQEFGLADLAACVIAPLLKKELVQWQPLKQPTKPLQLVKQWRALLQRGEPAEQPLNIFDPYSSLIWAGVMPSFRSSATNWHPKDHAPLAALLDVWAPLLPTWVLDSVLEQLVLPRLIAGVEEWDPLTDTVPIDSWVLPWHAILGNKMEQAVYPQIRSKLGIALRAWLPQDRSARAMLTPWAQAFPEVEMQVFLQGHIVPKLQAILGEFLINPLHQDLELWNQVWEWHVLIDPRNMAQLLDKHFFPRWMQVLVLWLNQSPDYVEISRWYTGWKSMLSASVLREPSIKEHLRRALDMMNRASDALLPPASATTPPPQVPPASTLVGLLHPAMMMDMVHHPAQLEFKELVSQRCADLGILFAPLPGRREMGKQVCRNDVLKVLLDAICNSFPDSQIYRVGKLFCYLDRNVCMLSDGGFKKWKPAGLQQLLERSQTGIL